MSVGSQILVWDKSRQVSGNCMGNVGITAMPIAKSGQNQFLREGFNHLMIASHPPPQAISRARTTQYPLVKGNQFHTPSAGPRVRAASWPSRITRKGDNSTRRRRVAAERASKRSKIEFCMSGTLRSHRYGSCSKQKIISDEMMHAGYQCERRRNACAQTEGMQLPAQKRQNFQSTDGFLGR